MSTARNIRRLVKRKLKGTMGQKRYITVLEELPIYELDGTTKTKDDNGPLSCSMSKFVDGRSTDPAFVSETPRDAATVQWNMAMVVSAEAVRAHFRGKKPGDVVELEEDDWERLNRATVKGSYHPSVAASLIPFMRAVKLAQDSPPKKEEVTTQEPGNPLVSSETS